MGTLEDNINRLARYAQSHRLQIRPHAKTHKSVEIVRRQLAHGAVGITVAKPSEADALADACDDVLLAYPVVDGIRAARVARLAQRIDLKLAVDSVASVDVLAEAARSAGSTIGVLVDMDVGLHRTGVASPQAACELAQHVDRSLGVKLRGLFCYPGHVWSAADSQRGELEAVAELLTAALELWRRSGLNAEIVSGGSTPTVYQSHLTPQLTELRPGTYVFNDMNTVSGGYATIDQCAARIVTTVVSDAVPGQVVIDAGSKTLAADRCIPAPDSGHGYVVEYPDAKIVKLSEEHGQIDVSLCVRRPAIGERLTVIPNHICPCINLQAYAWRVEPNGQPTKLTIDARGCLT